MKIIDTHAHYDDRQFDPDRYELIEKMLGDSVLAFINIGYDIKSSHFSADLSEKYEGVFAAVGIHPESASDVEDGYIEKLKALCKREKVVAIGEIGLDYHYEGYDREKQIELFKNQIILAKELDLPIVIHSRDASEDTMNILRELRPEKAVMHCYSGSAETAAELIKMGIMISFTGVLTFKNSKKAVQVCELVPIEMLMVETDCPYMAPTGFRGQRCDSSMTHITAEKLAEIKGISKDEAIRICNENAVRFFGLNLKY